MRLACDGAAKSFRYLQMDQQRQMSFREVHQVAGLVNPLLEVEVKLIYDFNSLLNLLKGPHAQFHFSQACIVGLHGLHNLGQLLVDYGFHFVLNCVQILGEQFVVSFELLEFNLKLLEHHSVVRSEVNQLHLHFIRARLHFHFHFFDLRCQAFKAILVAFFERVDLSKLVLVFLESFVDLFQSFLHLLFVTDQVVVETTLLFVHLFEVVA